MAYIMNWTERNDTERPSPFRGSKGFFVTIENGSTWFLACWDHSQACGWYLYQKEKGKKQKMVTRAGGDSLQWESSQVQRWAEEIIRSA